MANYDQFNQMALAFDATFEPESGLGSDAAENTPVKTIDEIKYQLATKQQEYEVTVPSEGITFGDQSYILQELRVGVELLSDVAETCRQDLGQGSKASSFMAFAELMRERRETIKDLRDTNIKAFEINNNQTPTSTNTVQNNTMIFNGNEAFDIIHRAINGLDPKMEI